MIPREGPRARIESPVASRHLACRRAGSIDLNAAVAPYLGWIVVALVAAVLVLVLVAIVQARRVGRMRRRLESLTRDGEGRSLEAMLEAHLDKVYAVAREVDELSARSAVLEAGARKAIQRVGLVRYNPFEETGGNQSFALALTDAVGDGIIVSSLHARSGTRVYAKSIVGGKSDGALSHEEAEALRLAMTMPPAKVAAGTATRARASV
ncbi:MAG TPA: DUF4446 family protein [Candidatus Limnocylindrales bacterium]|nr:DUF4446 family protein [Candidatus Limnocylindrales bacterium]